MRLSSEWLSVSSRRHATRPSAKLPLDGVTQQLAPAEATGRGQGGTLPARCRQRECCLLPRGSLGRCWIVRASGAGGESDPRREQGVSPVLCVRPGEVGRVERLAGR